MAKKITIESLKIQLGELESKEQTAEVMAQVDAIKATIADMEAKEKELADEIARNQALRDAEKEAKKKKRNSPFLITEVFQLKKRMEPVVENGKQKVINSVPQVEVYFDREKKIKEVKILREHIDILNSQKENTLIEYVEKEA